MALTLTLPAAGGRSAPYTLRGTRAGAARRRA